MLILYIFSQPTPPMLAGKDTAAVVVNGSLSSKAILKAGLPGHQQDEQEVAARGRRGCDVSCEEGVDAKREERWLAHSA